MVTVGEFLNDMDFEVQGRIVIARYDSKNERRETLALNASSHSEYNEREIGYIYPEVSNGEAVIVIELKESEEE